MTQLRVDARENRDRVLAAARELFATQGLGVPMRQVARRAGVGPATLYRRFPTKPDLLLAAFADELDACGTIVRERADAPDAWRALCEIIERLMVLNAGNRGFTDAFVSAHPDLVDLAGHRDELGRAVMSIAERAKTEGALRPDFVLDDFVMILLAGRGLAAVPSHAREGAVRRLAAVVIDGLRAPSGGE